MMQHFEVALSFPQILDQTEFEEERLSDEEKMQFMITMPLGQLFC